jgi:hypothetical protein
MSRWLFENLGLKILALFISVALWAYVGTRQIIDRRVTIPVELTDIPVGVTVDPRVRTSVPVVLTGRKESVLDLDADEMTAVVSLKGTTPDLQEALVHPQVRPLPKDVAANVQALKIPLIPAKPKPTAGKKK